MLSGVRGRLLINWLFYRHGPVFGWNVHKAFWLDGRGLLEEEILVWEGNSLAFCENTTESTASLVKDGLCGWRLTMFPAGDGMDRITEGL